MSSVRSAAVLIFLATLATATALAAPRTVQARRPFNSNPKPLEPPSASRFAALAMMASNSYHNPTRQQFPLRTLGWFLVDRDGRPTHGPSSNHKFTGLAYDIYEHRETGEAVVAFRGTDGRRDWLLANLALGISPPYRQAKNEFETFLTKHPGRKILVTGHSLGGGLALSMSARFGVPAVIFDSSPRVFDGLGDHHKKATRELVYQNQEILEKVRRRWSKISELVHDKDIYRTDFNFGEANNHRADCLARGILEMGATHDTGLQVLLRELRAVAADGCKSRPTPPA